MRAGLTPSFSSSSPLSSLTQEPGVAMPIADRKNERVPEPDCGMNAWIGAFAPPTWLQLVSVQL